MKEKIGRDRVIQLFDDLDTAKLLDTSKYREACNTCLYTKAESLISTCDKEWIDWWETFFRDLTTMSDTKFEEKYGISYHLDLLDIVEQIWEKRKIEVRAK